MRKGVFKLSSLHIRPACPGLDNGHVPGCLGIILVNLQYLQKGFACLRVGSAAHIERCQQQVGLDKVRVYLHHLRQLQNCQIVVPGLGLGQRLVVPLDILAYCIQPLRLSLNLIQIVVGPVVLLLEIHADDPLNQSV